MKKVLILFTLISLALSVHAQENNDQESTSTDIKPNNWAISLNAGMAQFYGDIAQNTFYYPGFSSESEPSYAVFATVEKHFTPWYALRLRGGYTSLHSTQDNTDPMSFESNIIDFYLENKISLSTMLFPEAYQKKWSSYALLGYGFPLYRTKLTDHNGDIVGVAGYSDNGETKEDRETAGSYSVGIGFRFKLSQHLALSAEATINSLNKDNLDALPKPQTSQSRDKYGYTSIGLVYTFGKNDRQVPMEYHPMPAEDLEVQDKLDSLTKAMAELTDKVDDVEEKADRAIARFEGPDSDGDGIADAFDKEPNTESNALVNWQGETIPDHSEELEELTDRKKESIDGASPGSAIAYESVYFGINSAYITPENMKKIAKVAQIMLKNNEVKFKIVGSTCKLASSEYNMDLSKRRAEAAKKVLVENYGIDEDRLETNNVGEEKPLVEEPLYINRRVDFYMK
ncbi:MAG: OmpA family protein [Bacteroidales bacterium]